MMLVILTAMLASLLFPGEGTHLERTVLTQEDHPRAVCNDGTRAVYYHTPNPARRYPHDPPPPTPQRFVIFLQGGYFCDNREECIRRCTVETPYYCTQSRLEALDDKSPHRQGILSDDPEQNPNFADYYKVYLSYCTSDMYIGERSASDETGGYHFQGWAVFTALINSLNNLAGLSESTQVVLTGTSAGGRGAAFTCPHLRTLLPASVEVKCVVDAAIFYPEPFVDGCRPFNQLIQAANDFWRGKVEGFDINTWWKTYPMDLFISIQAQDAYAHLYNCIDPSRRAHLQQYGASVSDLARRLQEEAPYVGLFMPSCNRHPLITDPAFFSKVRAGLGVLPEGQEQTLSETLGNWLRGEGVTHAWDDCSGSGTPVCNPGCDDPLVKGFIRYPLEEIPPVSDRDKATTANTQHTEL